jgi:hypothetical protein
VADWLVAFGTIALAIIAAFQDRIRSIFWSPSLDCEIELSPPDCHRTVSRGGSTEFYSFYYRFKVWNKGKVSAKNVEVLINDILKRHGTSFKRVEAFSPDNLKWSTLFDIVGGSIVYRRYCDYISPGTYKHCNLGHVHDPNFRTSIPGENNPNLLVRKDETIFCFDVHFRSNILYYLVEPGEYQIQIKVGCENAKTITKKYLVKISGKWFEDENRMLNEGVSVETI